MGQRHDPYSPRTQAVISEATVARGTALFEATGNNDVKEVILPILGISEVHSADLILSLSSGSKLILDLVAGRVEVYYGASQLGWLGGNVSTVIDHLRRNESLTCILHDIGGSTSEHSATVAIYL
jgi:hypothetical protein